MPLPTAPSGADGTVIASPSPADTELAAGNSDASTHAPASSGVTGRRYRIHAPFTVTTLAALAVLRAVAGIRDRANAQQKAVV